MGQHFRFPEGTVSGGRELDGLYEIVDVVPGDANGTTELAVACPSDVGVGTARRGA